MILGEDYTRADGMIIPSAALDDMREICAFKGYRSTDKQLAAMALITRNARLPVDHPKQPAIYRKRRLAQCVKAARNINAV